MVYGAFRYGYKLQLFPEAKFVFFPKFANRQLMTKLRHCNIFRPSATLICSEAALPKIL